MNNDPPKRVFLCLEESRMNRVEAQKTLKLLEEDKARLHILNRLNST